MNSPGCVKYYKTRYQTVSIFTPCNSDYVRLNPGHRQAHKIVLIAIALLLDH